MKQAAQRIGRWAEMVLEQTEYVDPLSLKDLTVEKLRQIEQSSRDELSEIRKDYPATGAEEVVQEELLASVNRHPWAVDDDTAFQLEMDRQQKETPIEEQIADLERLKDLNQYPLRPENLDRDEIMEKGMRRGWDKLQEVEKQEIFFSTSGALLP